MIFETNLPKSFWTEAVLTATYLMNRSPHRAITRTSAEVWSGSKPNLSHLRVFGTKAMAYIHKVNRSKWDAKSCETIMVGYSQTSKAYRLYDPASRKVITPVVT